MRDSQTRHLSLRRDVGFLKQDCEDKAAELEGEQGGETIQALNTKRKEVRP